MTVQSYLRAVVLVHSELTPDPEGSKNVEMSRRDLKLYPRAGHQYWAAKHVAG